MSRIMIAVARAGARALVLPLTAAALVAYWWHTEREADRRWGERGETRTETGGDDG